MPKLIIGQLSARSQDITGKIFGRLTSVSYAGKDQWGMAYWNTDCSCGNKSLTSIGSLNSGNSKSCGCLSKELAGQRSRTHGASKRGPLHKTYSSWLGIKDRCVNPSNKHFERYGGRGIKLCQGWFNSFEAFLNDMGVRPSKKSIDRKNNDGNYSCGKCEECKQNGWPLNCRWATDIEQANNRSCSRFITFKGKTLSVAQWERELGFKPEVIKQRLNKLNWPVERALTEPSRFD